MIGICVHGSRKGFNTFQLKRRIILMETNSHASTNGAFLLQGEPMIRLMMLPLGLSDFVQYDEKFIYPTRPVEVYSKDLTLVPQSVQDWYPEYRLLTMRYGIPVLSMTQWQKAAENYLAQTALAIEEQRTH
jgi:hypothetical protein